MSTPTSQHTQAPSEPNAEVKKPRGNGVGITALVLGLGSLVFSWIPIVNIVAIICAVIGIVFGLIGLFKSHRVMSVIGGIAAVVAIIVAISMNNAVVKAVDPNHGGAPAATAKIGAPATDGQFTFTITSVSTASSLGGAIAQKAQGEYHVLHISVTNHGNGSQTLSDVSQSVYDAGGRKFAADSGADAFVSGNTVLLQPINPGNTVQGQFAFDMPIGDAPVTAELHDSPFSSGVSVNLK